MSNTKQSRLYRSALVECGHKSWMESWKESGTWALRRYGHPRVRMLHLETTSIHESQEISPWYRPLRSLQQQARFTKDKSRTQTHAQNTYAAAKKSKEKLEVEFEFENLPAEFSGLLNMAGPAPIERSRNSPNIRLYSHWLQVIFPKLWHASRISPYFHHHGSKTHTSTAD